MRRLLCGVLGIAVALGGLTPVRAQPASTKQIAFAPPIDFATGAVPSSAGFNAAAGDQLVLQLTDATLSDGLAVGDFNGDGNPDVAQTNVVAGSLSVFLGDGHASFAAPLTQAVGMHPNFVATADLDLDGHLDLAVANYGSHNVAILRGNGHGAFRRASSVSLPAPRNLAVANFNGDEIPDLAVVSAAPAGGCPASCGQLPEGGGVAILTGTRDQDGQVTYVLAQLMTHTHSASGSPVSPNFVAADDLDGDGVDDLVVAVGSSRNAGDENGAATEVTGDDLLIHLNRNRSSMEPFGAEPDQPAIRVGASPEAVVVRDWNGDSNPDLVVAHSGDSSLMTLLGDSQGRFVVADNNVTLGAIPRSLAAGDLDGDGVADLAAASFGSSTVSVLRGNGEGQGGGPGSFQPAVDFWVGNAPTSVAMGHFDADGRLDIVAARVRTDQLSLLLNDSPRRGDGVVIERDIAYGSATHPTHDPFAAHHTLDVYVPPKGTPSFARGKPYPVLLFAHGGAGVAGDKSMYTFLMRSLALEGIVAVSTDYRLGFGQAADQVKDLAQAFRWTRDHIGSKRYRGDAGNIFVMGQSAGASIAVKLATDPVYRAEQEAIRGFVAAGPLVTPDDAVREQPPSLFVSGDEGLDLELLPLSAAYAALAADSRHVIVPGRDHLTILGNMARSGDPARVRVLEFLRDHLRQ